MRAHRQKERKPVNKICRRGKNEAPRSTHTQVHFQRAMEQTADKNELSLFMLTCLMWRRKVFAAIKFYIFVQNVSERQRETIMRKETPAARVYDLYL